LDGGTYATVPQQSTEDSSEDKKFHLDQERIANMAQVIQFLEQQKHNFD